jgi:hypothetical protein
VKDVGALAKDGDLATRELASRCVLPGGTVRDFAGLLASMTAVAQANAAAVGNYGEPTIAVPKSALTQGETGSVPAEIALNDVAVQRLLREGRSWFVTELAKIRDAHRTDVIQYVKYDSKKESKKSVSWPDRYAKILLTSYHQFLQTRPPTWIPLSLTAYLGHQWAWPVRDTPSPLDLTGMWVQIGVLSLVNQCENWDVLGESLQSVRAHLVAAHAAFQAKYVLCSANLQEHKALKAVSSAAVSSSQRWANRPPDAVGGIQRDYAARTTSGTALKAERVPAARAAGILPSTTVYTACQAHGCRSTPPGGFALGKFCTEHATHRQPHRDGAGPDRQSQNFRASSGRGRDGQRGRGGRGTSSF